MWSSVQCTDDIFNVLIKCNLNQLLIELLIVCVLELIYLSQWVEFNERKEPKNHQELLISVVNCIVDY